MKKFGKLASLCLALMFAFGLGAFASCTNGGDSSASSSESETLTAYKFIVLNADNSAAQNVYVQLCAYQDNGELGTCYAPVAVDENGIVSANPAGLPGAGVYQIHLLNSAYEALEFNGLTDTPAEYSEITLTLKN